ncbi:uncharacterized protein METZ01_LOCUS480198 [marine metagenome]|uniref:Uncharacterized protein n=1 Tax=marine metagenome TaxID=408172 RepID=A0A383C584_9ZZZZ
MLYYKKSESLWIEALLLNKKLLEKKIEDLEYRVYSIDGITLFQLEKKIEDLEYELRDCKADLKEIRFHYYGDKVNG